MTEAERIAAASCEVCGAAFIPNPYRAKHGMSKCCSRECGQKKAVSAFRSSRKIATDEAFVAAFWDRTEVRGPDDCWPWVGVTIKANRGVLHLHGRREIAPRVAYFIKTGQWLAVGEFACHTCDNPNCVNPAHIWKGDLSSNARDMFSKGRAFRQGAENCIHGHRREGVYKSGKSAGRIYCKVCARIAKEKRKVLERSNDTRKAEHD